MNQTTAKTVTRFNPQSLEVIRLVCQRHQDWIMKHAWTASERLSRALKGEKDEKDAYDTSLIPRSMRYLQELLGELIAIEQLCNSLKGGRR